MPSAAGYCSATAMEEEETMYNCFPIPNPMSWFTKIVLLQADVFHDCLLLLLSPFLFLLSLASEIITRADETRKRLESVVHAAARVPSAVVHGTGILLKKVVVGVLGAVYMGMVLMVLLAVAAILGVGLVQIWVDEPVFMRERLHFDYTESNPTAAFAFDGGGDDWFGDHKHMIHFQKQQLQGISVGHTFYVSLDILMPESDYNREIGVFQVSAEIISTNGNTTAKSSQPFMLRYRSWPIKMARTLIMGLPLLLGITAETQRIKIAMLKHKEGFPRTRAILVTLVPRAGTNFHPQLYKAEIVLKSELPWAKDLVYRWKWTFYVWPSFYAYVLLLMILLCCFRPLILPVKMTRSGGESSMLKLAREAAEEMDISRNGRGLSKALRKSTLLHRDEIEMPETFDSCASSISLNREDTGNTLDYGDDNDTTEDSESASHKGFHN